MDEGREKMKDRQLLRSFQNSLTSFRASGQSFRILSSHSISSAKSANSHESKRQPKTLFVLDSSFNPPSRAHFALARAAVTRPHVTTTEEQDRYPKPWRLLLLFATTNADKAAKPAAFEHRIAMMNCLANDLADRLAKDITDEHGDLGIDVGVTTSPYYVGKSEAISASSVYPSEARHIHLVGYDTVIRFLTPKYYKEYDPPLSALQSYFENRHSLLVALRPVSSSENLQDAGSQTVSQQRRYIQRLAQGALEEEGFRREWAAQISILEAQEDEEGQGLGEAVGVSSTAIRKAVQLGDWDTVNELCTPSVAEWIKKQNPYGLPQGSG